MKYPLSKIINYSGVRLWDKKCNSGLILVYFSVSITSTKLWESNYSDYQQYLYDRIKGFIENSVTYIGYCISNGLYLAE